jgi:hypothetical protein
VNSATVGDEKDTKASNSQPLPSMFALIKVNDVKLLLIDDVLGLHLPIFQVLNCALGFSLDLLHLLLVRYFGCVSLHSSRSRKGLQKCNG